MTESPVDFAKLQDEWEVWQARAQMAPHEMEKAVAWVLIHCFGDMKRYHYDAEFHTRVGTAGQMLRKLRDDAAREIEG